MLAVLQRVVHCAFFLADTDMHAHLQAHPGLMAASMPWLSGLDFKRLCTWFPYVSIILVLTRDKGSGRVTIGRDGLPRVHYWPDAHDRASMMNVSFCRSRGSGRLL